MVKSSIFNVDVPLHLRYFNIFLAAWLSIFQ